MKPLRILPPEVDVSDSARLVGVCDRLESTEAGE